MAEDTKKLSPGEKLVHFFHGVKAEYSKIIFPNQETLKKRTVAVLITSVFIGALIFVLDFVMKYLLGLVL